MNNITAFRKLLLSWTLVPVAFCGLAQHVKIISQSTEPVEKISSRDSFYYAEDSLTTAKPIARLEVTADKKPYLMDMYDKLKDQSKKMGGNGFRIYHAEESKLVVDIYRLTDTDIEKNKILQPKNIFYVFAGEDTGTKEYHSFEMNGAMKSLKTGTYYQYQLDEGEHIKLKKGSIAGTTVWVKWKPNQLPNYFTIEGFYREAVVKRTTVSQPDRNAKLRSIDTGLGALLIRVLTPKEEQPEKKN